jgi:hypothetical protein
LQLTRFSPGDFSMIVNADRYANWKAPSGDGQVLLWPAAGELLAQTNENVKKLASADAAAVQGIPVSRLRKSIRNWLGHGDQPLIATGHQTELYHPGVWAKDAAINAIADRIGGSAFHFAVDTDQPKHLNIRWPGSSLPMTDDPAISTADWSGLLTGPTPAHLESLEQSFRQAAAEWNFQPMLGEALASLRRSSLESTGLSVAITDAQHQLDWSLGLKHRVMMVSPMLYSQAYLVFVHHVLSRASEFAADYNAALADYRREAGITSVMRPMPDLHMAGDRVEVPFWLDDLAAGKRSRAEVCRIADSWVLSANGVEFVLKPDADGETVAAEFERWLRSNQLRLSPRALTLTTFLRLLVVDQFIHGIGGGRYDQVTDRLLGEKKREIVQSITMLPRRSIQRSLAFHNMHGALSAAAQNHPALAEWSARFELTQQKEREELVIFDRELFYAMQTRERLMAMIEATNNQLAGE